MSGIGHFAPAFAAKTVTPALPLWVLLIAGETNDLLYFVFSSTGLEPKSVIASMDFNQGVKYLAPVTSPLSHGFFMSAVWAFMAGALAWLFTRDRRAGVTLGLVVFSHWLLDFLMHSNLSLFLNDSPLIGLGLENTGSGFLFMTVLDLVLLAAGITYYFVTRKRAAQSSKNILKPLS